MGAAGIMRKLGKDILARDARRDIGAEVLQAIRDIKAGKTGRVFRLDVTQSTEASLKQRPSLTRG
jgi:putative transcriptional regulator